MCGWGGVGWGWACGCDGQDSGSVPVAKDPLGKDSGSLGSLRNLWVLLGQKGLCQDKRDPVRTLGP